MQKQVNATPARVMRYLEMPQQISVTTNQSTSQEEIFET